MTKIENLIQRELGNISEEEMQKARDLINDYGLNDFVRALVKASYNNLRDLQIVERILKQELFRETQDYIAEILSATDTEYTNVVEETFQRELSPVEKYLLNNACSNYSIEDLKRVLQDERLKDRYNIHHIEDLLKLD